MHRRRQPIVLDVLRGHMGGTDGDRVTGLKLPRLLAAKAAAKTFSAGVGKAIPTKAETPVTAVKMTIATTSAK